MWHQSRVLSPMRAFAVCLAVSTTDGCGLQDLSVHADMAPLSTCDYQPDAQSTVASTSFDVLPTGTTASRSSPCQRPYVAHLLASNDNSVALTVTGADVTLLTEASVLYSFDGDRTLRLPNPLSAKATGTVPAHGQAVVTVEEFPLAYARQLDTRAGATVLAEATVHARSSDGDTTSSNMHVTKIALCAGCRSACASTASGTNSAPMCSSAALGDNRIYCVDDGC
ncbi:MAG TPA: hypothetical protein VF331_02725 [Polyangiales bacterium]